MASLRLRWRLLIPTFGCFAVVGLWLFPGVWYTQKESGAPRRWLKEQAAVPGWRFEPIPIGETAERALVADQIVNGDLTNDRGEVVRVFSAKRFQKKENEIGLFVHTPDRCWTQAGWQYEPTDPTLITFQLHGLTLAWERRIFRYGVRQELVYFCGLVAGQTLPYRLDHNLSVARKFSPNTSPIRAIWLRLADGKFWRGAWDGFVHRRPLLGPKQFLRVSTAVEGDDVAAADQLLEQCLKDWLKPIAYQEELGTWRSLSTP